MTDELTCPYCNAQFAHATAEESPRGLSCPRCGEPLPLEQQTAITVRPTGITAASLPAPAPKPSRHSNWLIGVIVLLVMVTMALVGLGFALQTTAFRRGNDRKVVPAEPTPSPTEWSALGYLPANCNLIAGMQLADLIGDPLGKQLLAEPAPPFLDLGRKQLAKWTGLKLDDIHHVVAGLNFDGKIPQIHIVASTRDPYRIDDLARPLKLERMGEHRGKALFGFRLQPLGEGRLWCPDPQDLVLVLRVDGFSKGDLDGLPFPARDGSQGLTQPMQDLLSRKLEKRSIAWLCGHGDWKPLLNLIPREKLAGNDKDADILARVKTFALSLTLEKDIMLHAQLFTGDAALTESLKSVLLNQAEKASLIVEGPPMNAGPEAQWVTLRRTLTVQQARQFLGESR